MTMMKLSPRMQQARIPATSPRGNGKIFATVDARPLKPTPSFQATGNHMHGLKFGTCLPFSYG
jgi:hypothetical protein